MFIAAKIGKLPVEKAIKGTIPYLISEIIVLLMITYIPFLVLAVPRALGLAV